MSEWKKYLNNRLIKFHEKDFAIIIPEELDGIETIPLSCPLCKFLYRSQRDENSHKQYGCCDRCVLENLTESDSYEKWKNGWRPSEEQIQNNISKRPNQTINFDIDI